MPSPYEFRTSVIQPIECMQEGWKLIKDQYWLFFAITMVGVLIAAFVPFGVLMGAMYCGIYLALFNKMNGRAVSFENLFGGFNFFVQSLIVSMLIFVPIILVTIPAYGFLIFSIMTSAENHTQPFNPGSLTPGIFIAVALLYLFIGVMHLLMTFAFPLVVEHKLSGIEAFKLSARAVLKNLGGVILFFLCQFALVIIGMVLCYVGVFFVLPVIFAGNLVMYRRVFPAADTGNFNNPPPPNAFRGAGNYN